MNIIRSLPCHIDYILGILMIACGAYAVYGSLVLTWYLFDYLDVDGMLFLLSGYFPNFWLIAMGIVMILLPKKNIRRTIWSSAFILSGYCLISAAVSFIFTGDDIYSTYDMLYFFLALVDSGCFIAFFVNGLYFKYRKTSYIYAITIATVALFIKGYIQISSTIRMFGWEGSDTTFATTLPIMILCVVFALVFTSKEVSWYTSSRGILNAVGRIHSTEDTSSGFTVSRGFLSVLTLPHGDFSSRVWCGRYRAVIEVFEKEGGRDVVITRDGNGSLAGAVRLVNATIVPQGSIDTCSKLMIYGPEGVAVRLDVDEPQKGSAGGKKRSDRFGIIHPGSVKLTRADALRILRDSHAEVPCRGRKGTASITVDRDNDATVVRFVSKDGKTSEADVRFMSKDGSDMTFDRLFLFLPDGRYVLIKVKDTLSEKSAKYKEERLKFKELFG